MENQLNYYKIPRSEWRQFYRDHYVPLTSRELMRLKSLNDVISLQDVEEIYMPLVHLLGMRMEQQAAKQANLAEFLGIENKPTPFILGIAGSVAVGKSTVARLLSDLLTEIFPDKKVQQITTDGFLYSSKELKAKHLLSRKGFPESYDMESLIKFINDVKNGLKAKAPVYSHQIYDRIEGKYDVIDKPDILILEGINVLQLPENQQIYVSDFFDFSIYVDADEKLIEKWYFERFDLILERAKKDPTNYYYGYAQGDRDVAHKMAGQVWQDVNHKNLHEYILPTRNRADLVLTKGENHLVDELFLRKF
ncbi:pantothenate kinase [Ligilactobacillus salitolerans]|uniref:Pantothenate kinase n=1 Tax=Ligilactobacillus salitolerans TaxID=1808352 RepID=A0A401IU44_9LACO|nr:type I pantothenate kinase [Ligilactobacillus salitolerans]GBG95028.1 pantothenate kinase [Ligilactobacillus salitolerans]